MPRLREVPSPAAFADIGRIKHARRQPDVIARRLDQLEHNRDALLRAATACRASRGAPTRQRPRDRLLQRITAIGYDIAPFATLRALHRVAA